MLEAARGLTARQAVSAGSGRARTKQSRPSERRRRALLARLSAMSLGESPEGEGSTETEATVVARAWLDLIHSGRSASSWAAAAPAFREMITPEEWQEALRCVRVTLGRCRSRRLRSQTDFEGFPGIPPGPYAVIHFESGFEERSRVVETVTTCRGPDGYWRATAYFVG